MSWDHEVDLLAVGSGLGGLCAAIAAHDAGLRVLVTEKAPKLGGVCAYSGGEVFVPCNHRMAEAGQPDTEEAGRAYLDFLAGGYSDPKLADVLFREGPPIAQHLEQRAGIRWKIISDFPDYHYPHAPGTVATGRYLEAEVFDGAQLGKWQTLTYGQTPHMPPGITHEELFSWGGLAGMGGWDFSLMGRRIRKDQRGMGPGMMGWFLKAALVDRSIDAWVRSPVVRVLSEDGRVTGAVVRREGTEVRVRARRGVVLGVGGYDWHPDFPKYYEGLPDWKSMVQPSVAGDNLILGGELGAAVAGVPPYNLGMFFGYRIPGEEHEGKPLFRASWEGGYPHAIWVNRAGKRFCDESFYRDYVPRVHQWDGVAQRHPNYPPVLVFDQNYRDRYAFATWMPGMDVPEDVLPRSETLRGLAEQIGVDPAGLERTVSRFNSFADGATDLDFGRGRYPWAAKMTGDRSRINPNMGPLTKPPFYGIPLVAVGVGINAAGLRTDEHARVVHVRGHAIEGLYAVGNAAALLDTGAGYQSGISNLRGMVWGTLAGRHAAG